MSETSKLIALLYDECQKTKALEHQVQSLATRNAELASESAPYDVEDAARLIGSVAAGQSKVYAIKLHRQLTKTTLKDAKEAVERYWPKEEATQ